MRTDYARQYEALWRGHWWWQARRRLVTARLVALARRRPLRRILDIGCGNGLFFDELGRFGEVWGIEPDADLVAPDGPHLPRIFRRRFDDSFEPPGGEALDLVVMFDVLEHLADDLAAARHVRKILAPGGYFMLTVPALMALWSAHDEANLHYRRYTRGRLRRVLGEAGLRVESATYFFGWTLGPMMLRRLMHPAGRGRDKEYLVPLPAPPVNRALYAMSRLEQCTYGRWGLPLGTSLIAVARKDR